MDNAQTQSMVAYEDGPKEVNIKRGMPDGDNQFGKGNKMPQDEGSAPKKHVKHASHGRHKEHR
jgi:hypothetical protein